MGSGLDRTLGDEGDVLELTVLDALTVEQLVAVIRNDTEAYPDAGRVVVPAALEELQRRAAGGQGRTAARRALAELELSAGEVPSPIDPGADDPEQDGGDPDGVLEGAGMAAIDYTRRRYGMAGAGFISTAAGVAEETRGGEPGDLIVLSIPAGDLGRVMDLLDELGVRRPSRF